MVVSGIAQDLKIYRKINGKPRHETSALDILTRAVFSGWKAAVVLAEVCPKPVELIPHSTRLAILVGPYAAKGYAIGIAQVEKVLLKGHHITQQRSNTQPPPS